MIFKHMYVILMLLGCSAVFGQNSFTLQEAIDYAIKHSNEAKIKMVAIEDAAKQVSEVKSIGLPKINGSINYQHYLAVPAQPIQDFITPSVYNVLFDEAVIPKRDLGAPETFKLSFFQPNVLSGGLDASMMLFDGTYLYGVKAAKLYKELIAKEVDVTETTIRTNVTKAYSALLIANENKKVLDKNLTNISKSLREVKVMFDNCFAESLDVDRLQLSYDNINTELDRVNQLIDISENLLKFQMTYPLQNEITLTEDIDQILGLIILEEGIDPSQINFNKRPEYNLITLGQALDEIDLKRTKAGYLPTARANASVQASLQRQNLFDNTQTGWIPQSAIGVSINIPIYDGGDKSAKVQRIKLRQEKTNLEKQNFENAMTLQVMNATSSIKTAKKIVLSRKKAVDVNQNIYNKTLIKFKEGVGSSIEVTQAEAGLYQAQAAYTNAMYDLLSAKVDLQTALGK